MRVDELEYDLPEELVAQRPLPERDAARLLVLDRGTAAVSHRTVKDLPRLLEPALFVLNETRVLPARLHAHKPTGGKVELLLVERLSEAGTEERWIALGRASKPLRVGASLQVGSTLEARIESRRDDGTVEVTLVGQQDVERELDRLGEVPLPPYIRRGVDASDRQRYQTVFARRPGAVAAPTAGLHLSLPLLQDLERAGHRIAYLALHVGPGTFQPVRARTLESHRMHAERYEVPAATAEAVARARAERRPVVAVGTTVVRTLESVARDDGTISAGAGATELFIRPPFRFRAVDALLTNFHLPRSTLLALVMAFGGVAPVRRAYAEAVRARYRFFSYGDAMLIHGAGS